MPMEPPADDGSDDAETPRVACTLSEDEYRDRKPWLESTFMPLLSDVERDGDEVVLTFDGASQTVETVARFVNEESDCCSFATYEIAIEPPYDRTTLTVSGPPGTGAVFQAELLAGRDTLPESVEDLAGDDLAHHEPS